ncbi:MAG: hypothetical protein SFW64_02155 [Alphaproteobacteria bacterium]|nr:hypothetical protein [Alphaproteobacteria bacterium]
MQRIHKQSGAFSAKDEKNIYLAHTPDVDGLFPHLSLSADLSIYLEIWQAEYPVHPRDFTDAFAYAQRFFRPLPFLKG